MCDEKLAPAEFDVGAMKKRLNTWLEHSAGMTLWDCIQYPIGDGGMSDCSNRAKSYIPKTWGVSVSKFISCFNPAEQTEISKNIYEGSYSVVATSEKSKFVGLQVKAGWGGASKSRFKPGGGFHWVLLIAVGKVGDRKYSVIFDPDVTATKKTIAAWETCRAHWESLGAEERKSSVESPVSVPLNGEYPGAAARKAVLQCMLVGSSENQLGPLIRYHYEA